MSRSLKKGPYINQRFLNKIKNLKPGDKTNLRLWDRSCTITPEMVGFTFGVYNGKTHIEVVITEDMVGHRLGEFSPTKKFTKHGGKMQKELDQAKREAEITAAKSAKSTTETPAAPKK